MNILFRSANMVSAEPDAIVQVLNQAVLRAGSNDNNSNNINALRGLDKCF